MAESNEDVVGRFIENGRLVIVPSKRGKLLLVLDHVAQDFELGHTYPEAEVDDILLRYHDDHAALRRHLVDEGFLSREAGVYWRSGGTIEV